MEKQIEKLAEKNPSEKECQKIVEHYMNSLEKVGRQLLKSPTKVRFDSGKIIRDLNKKTEHHTCKLTYAINYYRQNFDITPVGVVRTLSDDPLPLKAKGTDEHVLTHYCECMDDESRRNHILQASVEYIWIITSGEGGFIEITDGTPEKQIRGEQVLFQPPDITDLNQTKNVTIDVYQTHFDFTKPPLFHWCKIRLELQIKREITEKGSVSEQDHKYLNNVEYKDEYVYTIQVKDKDCQAAGLPKERIKECVPKDPPVWIDLRPISGKIVSKWKEVFYGDYVRLRATGFDADLLELECIPSGDICKVPSKKPVPLQDVLEFYWSAEVNGNKRGEFPLGNIGKEVVWKTSNHAEEVTIKLKIKDIGGQFPDVPGQPKEVDKFTLNVRLLGTALVKTPIDWIPKATAGEIKIPLQILTRREGKWRVARRKKFARFKLKITSCQKGVCMNFPLNGNTNPDLFFYEEKMSDYILKSNVTDLTSVCHTSIENNNDNPAHANHYLCAITKERVTAFYGPTVRCEDYGAFGSLEVTANNCVKLVPLESISDFINNLDVTAPAGTENHKVKIPRDDNENDIADGDVFHDFFYDADEDADIDPASNHEGDGLTAYEEYRGFIIGGGTKPRKHIRTSCFVKDVFIYDKDNLLEMPVDGTTATGLKYFEETGLRVHVIYDPSLYNNNERVINFNHGSHHGGEQHGILIEKGTLQGNLGVTSITYPAGTQPPEGSPPKQALKCVIDVAKNLSEPNKNQLAVTIAHELGHAVNMWHHGPKKIHPCPGSPVQALVNGVWQAGPAELASGTTSGDVDCIMRYTAGNMGVLGWCDGNHHFHHYGSLSGNEYSTLNDIPGKSFCNSPTGTGLNNQNGHTNNATKGNCRSQIRVKDWGP